ncbi:MAG TPA: glutathione synthase [Polyangiales bacterium]|nr:glutathione synthase [Polyangiales bacterium]
MHFVVIMDPVWIVNAEGDTTFALMEAAERRGHRVDHCLNTDLYLDGGKLYARVARATTQRKATPPITLAAPEEISLHDVDAIFVRTDPPFDDNYLWCSLLLDRVKPDTLIVNDPHGLRQANEKLYACYFPELMPETIVTSHKQRIKDFVTRVGGHAVIKPLGGRGGEGVLVLKNGDPNINPIIEATTLEGKRPAMVQVFLPEVKIGDKRILLLDGEPIGAVLRVPSKEEVRSNLRVGGTAVKAELDDADKNIIRTLAPRLRQDGLYFVGIDVIGGKLTEVNVTSPTGIQSMERLDKLPLSERVIEWVENKAKKAG